MVYEKNNPLKEKSFRFSVRIIRLYQLKYKRYPGFPLFRQILRSGTSVGANIEEAIGGYSRADFRAKLGISYKEARETRYWLKLLHETEYLSAQEFESLFEDCNELIKIMIAILKSSKHN